MANNIYINTQLKDLTANAVANLNRPTQVVRLPQIIEGEVVDVVLHLVKSNGAYDARSGTAVDVAVAISAKGKAATSGTFKLNAGIESTGNLSWNASAEAVESALNALNGGSGAYGSKVSVAKLANGSYRVIFDDVGARVDMAGQSLDLAPESTIGISTSVVGSASIRAQQVIEISQQPAIYSETWASAGSTWTGQLNANTSRVQEMIAGAAEAFFEIKVGSDVVCQIPISILPSVAAPNSFPAHTLPDNLDAFAANPTTNGFFNPAIWREDLDLVVGEDVQAWSTNLDEVAAKMSWNNQDLTFDIATGSDGVVIQVGQEVLLYCRNPSGVELVDGDVVKINGATGGRPNIAKAIASNVSDARATIGVVTQTISNNGFGFIAIEGKVRGLSLPNGSFDEGDVLYLSDTVAGAFTKTEPDISVEIGHVVRTGNNNGELLVAIQNEASLYELKQQLLILINDNTAAIAAKVPNDSTTGTPSATTFLRGDNAWASIAGGGDMLKSVYDPSNKDASAFSMGNMDETATAKILTDTERSEIAANTSKVGITPTQAADIVTNNAKVGITPTQAADITTNNAKVGITTAQASDIVTNNAKVTNATHTGDVTGDGVLTIADDAVDIPMLSATGTADGTTFLRGDNVWATIAGAGDLLAANNLSELTPTASVARTNLELGAADTVEFGGFVPPSGTTAEIDAVTTAVIGQVMIDTDRKRQVRFTGSSTYEYIGSAVSRTIYFVDPDNGDDALGLGGYFPFATINAALKAAVTDGQVAISVNCLPAAYTEQDAFNGVVTTSIISINFENGSLWTGSAQTLPMFDNTTANLNVYEITGSLAISGNVLEWWKGPFYLNGTNISLLSSVSWATGGPTINVTGGQGTISIALKCVSTSVRAPFLEVSGDANVDLNYLRFELPATTFNTVPPFSKLSGTATLKIKDSTFKGYGLCEITTDTACKLILSNSATAAQPAPPFLGQVKQSVAAPAASSSPTAYAFGSNAVDVAASNISVNVDLGTFTVSATALAVV